MARGSVTSKLVLLSTLSGRSKWEIRSDSRLQEDALAWTVLHGCAAKRSRFRHSVPNVYFSLAPASLVKTDHTINDRTFNLRSDPECIDLNVSPVAY